jgi:hypothetical protein
VTFGKYAFIVLATAASTQAGVLPLLPGGARGAVALGAALAAANALGAFALTAWGLKRPPRAFLAATLGGMAARLALVLGTMALLVAGAGLPGVPLAVSLLAYFLPFLLLELAVLHRSTPASTVAR